MKLISQFQDHQYHSKSFGDEIKCVVTGRTHRKSQGASHVKLGKSQKYELKCNSLYGEKKSYPFLPISRIVEVKSTRYEASTFITANITVCKHFGGNFYLPVHGTCLS